MSNIMDRPRWAETASDGAEAEAAIAGRARSLRAERGLTLDALAARAGISRAMLSRVERGESSPTLGLLVRLCDGLGVTLAALLGGVPARTGGPLARRADQPVWREPGSGYLRRAVSPPGTGSHVEIAEVELSAGAAVVLDPLDRAGHDRHVWVLDGRLEVAREGGGSSLAAGDCLRLPFDGPTAFRNLGSEVARYAVVTSLSGEAGKGG